MNYPYCAPHTFHLSGADPTADIAAMMRHAEDKLRHVHIADSFDHNDIGQGEVDWDVFFGTLRVPGFDGVATACVFAREERARESSAFMLDRIREELAG